MILFFEVDVKAKQFNSSVGTFMVYIQRKFLTSHILTMPLMSAVITYGLFGRHFTPINGWLCPLKRNIFSLT